MNKKSYRFQALLVALMLLMTGCYMKLVKPEPPVASNHFQEACSLKELKLSYYIYDLRTSETQTAEEVEKALLESFSACGIHDAIKSDRLEQDRLSMTIYVLDSKIDTNYLEGLLAFTAFLTLTIVPDYGHEIEPVEIHFIFPYREREKKLRVIQTDFRIAHWLWLPFLFNVTDEVKDSASSYIFRGREVKLEIEQLGFRRMFDRVMINLMKDQQSAGALDKQTSEDMATR